MLSTPILDRESMSCAIPYSTLVMLSFAAMVFATGTAADENQDKTVVAPHTVFELRQYTLHPGQREVLVNVFDDYFVEGQEQQGMRIIGQFLDRDNPDRFVWLRSFPDMPARAAALQSFYSGGPIWKTHGRTAASTMVDSDNVLLLRPLRPETAFATSTIALPPPGTRGPGKGLLLASIVYVQRRTPSEFGEFFEKELKPHWERAGASVIAQMVSEHSPNTYPSLPVREGENTFVWFSLFPDQAALDKHRRALAGSMEWRVLSGTLSLWTCQPIETMRLEPTARSRLQRG
jgi:hypothetical protein